MRENKENSDKRDEQPKNLDYEFWRRMPGWTITEAAALLLDLDPDRIQIKGGEDADAGAKELEYRRLRRLLKRAKKWTNYRAQCLRENLYSGLAATG